MLLSESDIWQMDGVRNKNIILASAGKVQNVSIYLYYLKVLFHLISLLLHDEKIKWREFIHSINTYRGII